jgi:hypothetical protein
MGGFGAMKLALRHPEVFGTVGSHAGPLEIVHAVSIQRDLVLAENAPGPPYVYSPGVGGMTVVMFARSGALSPSMSAPPYYVDFPYDELGDIVQSVLDRWRPHNPPRLAAELVGGGQTPPRVWFDCGINDDHLEYPVNEAFAESLDVLALPYVFESHPGGHLDIRWSASLPYMLECEPATTSIAGVEPVHDVMMRVVSSPGSGMCRIQFSIVEAGLVELVVYDVLGRSTRCFDLGRLGEGFHTVDWNGRDDSGKPVGAGVYFYELRLDGEAIGTRKAVWLE